MLKSKKNWRVCSLFLPTDYVRKHCLTHTSAVTVNVAEKSKSKPYFILLPELEWQFNIHPPNVGCSYLNLRNSWQYLITADFQMMQSPINIGKFFIINISKVLILNPSHRKIQPFLIFQNNSLW